jgi:hypothetical protein
MSSVGAKKEYPKSLARLFVGLVLVSVAAADIIADLITALPGLPNEPLFKMHSGCSMLQVAKANKIHYVLIESQSNPIEIPVVLC